MLFHRFVYSHAALLVPVVSGKAVSILSVKYCFDTRLGFSETEPLLKLQSSLRTRNLIADIIYTHWALGEVYITGTTIISGNSMRIYRTLLWGFGLHQNKIICWNNPSLKKLASKKPGSVCIIKNIDLICSNISAKIVRNLVILLSIHFNYVQNGKRNM